MTQGNDPKEIWSEKIKQFKESGMTQTEWCTSNNESIHRLKYWLYRKKKIKSEDSSIEWMPVKVETAERAEINTLKIKIGNAAVEVGSGVDHKLLLDVLRTLNAL